MALSEKRRIQVLNSVKRWRERNPEKARERAMRWYSKPENRAKAIIMKRDWYRRNRDRMVLMARERNKHNFEYRREWYRKHKYGITQQQYDEISKNQGNVCAICALSCYRNVLSVDHCHKTNKIRGLLCSKCNLMIGLAGDDCERLISAINYLKGKTE